MNPHTFRQLLIRYRAGQCTEQERNLVEKWYAELDNVFIKELDSEERSVLEKTIWSGIQEELGRHTGAKQRPLWPSRVRWGYAAASVLVLMSLSLYLFKFPVSKITRPAQSSQQKDILAIHRNTGAAIRHIVLPDGSRVSLHPASELRLSASFNQAVREVTLVGEAFFEVTKNARKPFVVRTRDITTRVLGTSFNVRAYPMQKNSLVFVKTGRVSVSQNRPVIQKSPVVLVPNQQLVFVASAGTFKKETVAALAPLAEHRMNFEEKPVIEVLQALEEAFGVPIRYDREALKDCNVTVAFHREDLPARLDLLCRLLGATYEEQATGIVIRGPGCGAVQ